ncbi:uncharacterized protein BDZ99DRAFT_460946 [Mytilinidion resinicola]|uniref:Uncharacterized protein n=1 Tax=Mytilinidion resinicola TaxID=574789 RepID=A0A6A6YUI0_9PEZI|nr:uncharacterized protein BDZ99DRAFT_460946 [Mytilinidion resinicola]KAF2812179.1 hypothetical protein BDZ99DRAFT_460946 [Mytilinidion resinicola]
MRVPGATQVISDQFRAVWLSKEKNAKDLLKTFYKDLYKSLASPDLVLDLDTFECVEGKLPKAAELPKDADKVLLLWARYSGGNKDEGYNPQGDSSLQGQAQLVAAAKKVGLLRDHHRSRLKVTFLRTLWSDT